MRLLLILILVICLINFEPILAILCGFGEIAKSKMVDLRWRTEEQIT